MADIPIMIDCPKCGGRPEDRNGHCVDCGYPVYPTGILELDYEWAKMLEAEKPAEFTYSSSDVFPSTSGNYYWVVNVPKTVTFTWNSSS